jgi:hypothetical protein
MIAIFCSRHGCGDSPRAARAWPLIPVPADRPEVQILWESGSLTVIIRTQYVVYRMDAPPRPPLTFPGLWTTRRVYFK